MTDENTPLLDGNNDDSLSDLFSQFCKLSGIPSSDKKHDGPINNHALYARASRKLKAQNLTYNFTAALSNTLLLSQVVLGATLTALGASESSHVLITAFGVLNTIIAGLVAYLKSRGQPMRARMFRDDLEHIVEEIENSKTMWLGIRDNVHGYQEIDIDDKVSVRSEIARLTRLYESAVKRNMQNNPEMYSLGGGMLDPISGLRGRSGAGVQLPPVAAVPEASGASAPTPVPAAAAAAAPETSDADESPATAKGTSNAIQKAKVESLNGAKDEDKDNVQAKGKSSNDDDSGDEASGPEDRALDVKAAAKASKDASKTKPDDTDAEPATTAAEPP